MRASLCKADRLHQTVISNHLSLNNARDNRAEYTRLIQRYRELKWCSSALDQRERAALQEPLMELHRFLYPSTCSVHLDVDFDAWMRTTQH